LYSEYVHPSNFQTIEIRTSAGDLLWSIPYEEQPTVGDPRPNLAIAGWSPDGASLYFYRSFSYDGAATLWSGFKLEAVDTASGRISNLIPSDGLMAFAFSPDFNQLAYVLDEDDPRVLYIRTLETGAVTNFKTTVPRHDAGQYTQAGSIRWSDSGRSLIVLTSTTDDRAALILFDLARLTNKRILDFWLEQYVVEEWSYDNLLRLHNVFEGFFGTMDLSRRPDVSRDATPGPSTSLAKRCLGGSPNNLTGGPLHREPVRPASQPANFGDNDPGRAGGSPFQAQCASRTPMPSGRPPSDEVGPEYPEGMSIASS
jgi:hypothetical protein